MRRVNLGCGTDIRAGYVSLDLRPLPGVDLVCDLRAPGWPLADNSVDELLASDIVEHLPDFIAFFDEAWRVLRPGGRITVRVPHANGFNTWLDPTHLRGYLPESFQYLDPRTPWGSKYRYSAREWHLVSAGAPDPGTVVAVLEVVK